MSFSGNCQILDLERRDVTISHVVTLTEIYIEALLVDEDLADPVWAAWNARVTDDEAACIAWTLIAGVCSSYDQHGDIRET